MIVIWIEEARGVWLGAAHHDGRLVATAAGKDRETALRFLNAALPQGVAHRVEEEPDAFAREAIRLIARLETGEHDEAPRFDLCPDCVGEPVAFVAHVASAIPRGFVATYGGIAASAGTDARVVGRVMATNPLYPIIPCHRVVGADFSLVGYAGRQDASALRAKLGRLRAEARGITEERTVAALAGHAALPVYPVERVLSKAIRDGLDDGDQIPLW